MSILRFEKEEGQTQNDIKIKLGHLIYHAKLGDFDFNQICDVNLDNSNAIYPSLQRGGNTTCGMYD